jgi:hypothetical protein
MFRITTQAILDRLPILAASLALLVIGLAELI